MNIEKIGKYIAKCRKKVNLTQEELANLMDITSKSVSKWECGLCLPDIDKMQPLCYFLRTNLFNLISGEDSEYKFFITKVGGTDIEKINMRHRGYQVIKSHLNTARIEKLEDIEDDCKKHIINVKINGFTIEEKDGFTYGNFTGDDGSMAVELKLNDNGEYNSRMIIDNIKIGNRYLCKGFVFYDEFLKTKYMIVEEIDEL